MGNNLQSFFCFVLNAPWSLIAVVLSFISLPKNVYVKKQAVIFEVRSFWWHPLKGVRAITLGNIILLGKIIDEKDVDHELVHIHQHMREPFVHPFLSLIEVLRKGSSQSKYEREAYKEAGNSYFHK